MNLYIFVVFCDIVNEQLNKSDLTLAEQSVRYGQNRDEHKKPVIWAFIALCGETCIEVARPSK